MMKWSEWKEEKQKLRRIPKRNTTNPLLNATNTQTSNNQEA